MAFGNWINHEGWYGGGGGDRDKGGQDCHQLGDSCVLRTIFGTPSLHSLDLGHRYRPAPFPEDS